MAIFKRIGRALECRYDGQRLRIDPWGRDSLRVREVPMGEILDTDFALLPPAETSAEITIGEDGRTAELRNGKIRVVVSDNGQGCKLHFLNQDGKMLLRDQPYGWALRKRCRRFRGIQGGDYALTVEFASNPEEKLYGMGQYQQRQLNLKNCTLELAQRNSQASVPFLVSSLGYGFLWHNPAVGEVSFGQNVTKWTAESTKQMDYWITAGDTPDEILQAYGRATGTVPMMPEYGLGFWQCKLRYWNQEQLLEVAREYHRRHIPVNVIVVDFFHWPRMGDMRFDEEFFPDPEAMVRELKEMGMELMVSFWPQVDLLSENYWEMKQRGYLLKADRGVEILMRFVGEAGFYDATNPEARAYVWNKCKQNYYDKGIRIFWLDEAEPEFAVCDYDNYRCHMGPINQVGNLYPQQYARTFYEGMRAAGQENPVNLLRCAWAGSQRYGALVWSGDIHSDWETFRCQVSAGLNMGMAGIPWWTTDIGGFSGGDPKSEAFQQLLVRWFQWGTFCPVMRLHGDRYPSQEVYRKDGTQVLNSGSDNEIWSYGESNEPILAGYIRLRERMRPYTRRVMEEAHSLGRPVMRTMFYEFPEDAACWDLNEQYLFGGDILVAPVLYENATQRSVYLPNGAQWTDFWTKEVYAGGQWVTVQAPIDQIPLFLRDGGPEELQ